MGGGGWWGVRWRELRPIGFGTGGVGGGEGGRWWEYGGRRSYRRDGGGRGV